jgi:Ca2+-binding EF-hand superfamily protein
MLDERQAYSDGPRGLFDERQIYQAADSLEKAEEFPEDRPPPISSSVGTAGYGADSAEAAVRAKIYRNFSDLREAFRALDRSNNGFVSREDFFQALGSVFLHNGYSEDDIYEVADRFDLNKDGYISFDEFCSIVNGDDDDRAGEEQRALPQEDDARNPEDDPQVVSAVDRAIQRFKIVVDQKYSSMRQAFLAMEHGRGGSLTPEHFARGLLAHGITLSPVELELAYMAFDTDGKGVISYRDFCAVMTQRFRFGTHLGRQMFK